MAYSVRRAVWESDEPAIRDLRQRVFIDEQGVPPELEWDGLDAECHHVVALDDEGVVVGTGRMTNDGKLGRMAVTPKHRGRGVGADVLRAMIDAAKSLGLSDVRLSAQQHALGFYERFGFVPEGPPHVEAGISHQRMVLRLA